MESPQVRLGVLSPFAEGGPLGAMIPEVSGNRGQTGKGLLEEALPVHAQQPVHA